MLFKLMVGKSF